MNLDVNSCYRALVARDRRFDGVFFVGVTSTGVYCRPICPARTPARRRCRFFNLAAAAERRGFRPCLRCRPGLAPGHAPVDSTSRLAWAAASRILEGRLNEGRLDELASDLGLTARHVRRIVRRELGASPIQIAQTQRLHFATQLLTQTPLPLTQVAFASGFASVRRFNSSFRSRYRLTPSDVRRARASSSASAALSLTLNYRPPFAWDDLLRFLADRATPGVEKVEGDVYSRTLAVDDCLGWLRVEHDQPKSRLVARLSPSLAPVLCHVLNGLRRLFDLDARPDLIDRHLAADPLLAPSVHSRPGLRAPGAMCGFELLVRAILGQQVSVRGATTLAGRLAERFGDPAPTPDPALNRLAPTASKLASLHETQLVDLGVTRQRARAVIAAARATVGGEWTLGPTVDPESALHRLTAIEGIGEWTARYVAMRALRWPDAFPSGDLVVRRMLGVRSPSQAERRAERWRPWRSYAVMHLWYSASSQSIQEK